jgi:hypothetical protein
VGYGCGRGYAIAGDDPLAEVILTDGPASWVRWACIFIGLDYDDYRSFSLSTVWIGVSWLLSTLLSINRLLLRKSDPVRVNGRLASWLGLSVKAKG